MSFSFLDDACHPFYYGGYDSNPGLLIDVRPNPADTSNNPLDSGIKIYPNPSTGIFNIDATVPVSVKVFSIDGRLIMEQENAKQIDLSAAASGLYLLQVFDTASAELLLNEKLQLIR